MQSKGRPALIQAVVLEKSMLAEDAGVVVLEAPQLAKTARPGQFVHVHAYPTGRHASRFGQQWPRHDPLLRRPISIHDVVDAKVYLLVQAVGRGSTAILSWVAGDVVDVLGPLGTSFAVQDAAGEVWLAGGGMGVAPLLFLARVLCNRGLAPKVFLGARQPSGILRLDVFQQLGLETSVIYEKPSAESDLPVGQTTSDSQQTISGPQLLPKRSDEIPSQRSEGDRADTGLVTDLIERRATQDGAPAQVFVCGPSPMIVAVGRWARKWGVRGQASLEGRMACGMGACLSCSCDLSGSGRRVRVCVDGPVVDLKEVF